MITKTRLLGTKIDRYCAWEPEGDWEWGHSSIRWEGDQKMGEVSSRRYPGILPNPSVERIRLHNQHVRECEAEAYRRIVEVYPEFEGNPKAHWDLTGLIVYADN